MTRYLKKAAPKVRQDSSNVEDTVRKILADIAENGDDAVRRYAASLDKWDRKEFRVTKDDFKQAAAKLPESFKEDFDFAHKMVTEFAKRQRDSIGEFEAEVEPGIVLGQKLIPVTSAGCYIPGGKYPLISAAIMSISTARVAGVENVIACAPPRDSEGMFTPQVYALHKAGADQVFTLGGVQALGAMAYGCLGMPAVDILTGPGNPFVAEAKRQLFGKVGIDLLAGPTEIMVIADETADPELVATDLLGQAEHGPDSPAWLITTSESFGAEVIHAIGRQLETLPTASIASRSWQDHGEVAVVADFAAAVALSDVYAPEHLELMTADNAYFLDHLKNYGSLFVGEESTVAYGDKGVGTNHTLPTSGAARYTGGLWVGKFIKTVTYQHLTPEASRRIAPIMGRLCHMEGMLAHEITADVRQRRYAA